MKSHLVLRLLMKRSHDSRDLMFGSKVSSCYCLQLQLVISLGFLKTNSAQVCLFCRMLYFSNLGTAGRKCTCCYIFIL